MFYGGEPKAKKSLAIFQAPEGSIIVPGLADAHAHLIQYGFKAGLPLDTAESLDDLLDILEAYVQDHPHMLPSEWITGWGWDQTRWKNWSGEFPTAVQDFLFCRISPVSRGPRLILLPGSCLPAVRLACSEWTAMLSGYLRELSS